MLLNIIPVLIRPRVFILPTFQNLTCMNRKRLLLVFYFAILLISSLVGHADGAKDKKKRDYYKVYNLGLMDTCIMIPYVTD